MLLTALSLYHVVLAFCVRDEYGSIFNREAIPHGRQLRLIGMAILLTVLSTELGILQRILDTVSLTAEEWVVCIVVPLSLLGIEEAIKFYLTRRGAQTAPQARAQVTPQPTPQAA